MVGILSSLSHSVSHFGAQTPKGETMGSEVFSASPLAAAQTGTSYTHIAFNFAFNIVIIFLTVSSKKLFFCSCFCYWYHIFAIFRPPFAFGKSREKLSPWDFTLCIICKKGFWFLRQGVKPANPQFMLPLLWNGSWQVLKVGLVFEVLFSSFSESTFQWWG